MHTRINPLDFPAAQAFILDIGALESRAYRLGMVATAQALNKAKNAGGWELAEQIECAQKSVTANQTPSS